MPVRLSMRRVCEGERRAADMQGCMCHAMYADMRERKNEAQIEDEDRKWKILVTTSLSDCRFLCCAHRCSLPSAHVDMGASVAEAFFRGVRAGVIAPGVCETGVAAVLRLNLRLQERLWDQ